MACILTKFRNLLEVHCTETVVLDLDLVLAVPSFLDFESSSSNLKTEVLPEVDQLSWMAEVVLEVDVLLLVPMRVSRRTQVYSLNGSFFDFDCPCSQDYLDDLLVVSVGNHHDFRVWWRIGAFLPCWVVDHLGNLYLVTVSTCSR